MKEQIIILTEWKKNRTWGMCPKVTITYSKGRTFERVESKRSRTGCGYCKESTEVAHLLNQIPQLKTLYKVKAYGVDKQGFKGGVGMSSTCEVFEKAKYKVSSLYTDNSNVYVIEK